MNTYISGDLPRERAAYLLTMQDECTRSFAGAWPYARWLKVWHDDELMPLMVWMNDAYVQQFGIDPYRYIGHCDRIVWPDEVATEFWKNDRAAIEQPETILTVREPTPRGDRPSWLVRKFAFRVPTQKAWGIYGECTPDQ